MPKTGQKVPISGDSRAVPAVWNVASASGLKVGVVGWWATHPAEEVTGFFVTDHASPILFQGLPRAGVAYPVSLTAGVEQIIARDGKVSDADLVPFIDAPLSEITSTRAGARGLENPYVALASILGATRVQQRIARDLYDRNLPTSWPSTSRAPTASATSSLPWCRRAWSASRRRTSGGSTERSTPTTRSSTSSWGSGCGGPRRTGRPSSSTRITDSSGAPIGRASARR